MPLSGEPPKDPRYTITIVVRRAGDREGDAETQVTLEGISRSAIMAADYPAALQAAVMMYEKFVPHADT